MPNPNKIKGNQAEREAARLISDHLGIEVVRRYNLGTHEDTGDLVGLDDTVIQVASWKDIASVLRVKPLECEEQRQRAGATFAATFVRLRGGSWRVVMTPEQFFTIYREATA